MAGHDEDPARTLAAAEVVQAVVLEVSQHHSGADAATIRDALNAALADRGIGEQPAPWVESTVEEIQMGRVVVVDPHVQDDVDEWRQDEGADRPAGRDDETGPDGRDRI